MATVIENLITTLSFDADTKIVEQFDNAIADVAKSLTAVVVAAGAATAAIFAFTKSIAASNDELGKFAERIGVDLTALQELGFVAELGGGSVDSMNSSLANLTRIASETAKGMGAGVEAFGMLGISVTDSAGRIKSADALYLELADSISALGTQAERLELSSKLGIGPDLLLSLQQGSEAIRQQRREARQLGFTIDAGAAKAAADFNDEMLKTTKIISGISSAIGTRLIKQITPMIKNFVEWFKINKAIIQQNLTAFLDRAISAVGVFVNVVGRVASMVLSLVEALGGWQNAIIIVTGSLLALNASALLMPVLAAAAGAGILLLLEDIVTFAKGGDSAIGQLAERFPALDVVLRAIIDLTEMIIEGWRLLLTEGDTALEGLILMFKDLGNAIKNFFLIPIEKGIDLFERFSNFDFKGQAIEFLNKIPGLDISGSAAATEDIRTRPGAGGIINQTTASVVNNTRQSNPVINLSIHGGDIAQVRQTVSDVLNEQYSGAQTNLESQVEF